jgi:RHS repeat-associated protein
VNEAFGDGSEQGSTFGDPRGYLTARTSRKSATDLGTTIGYDYDARGYLRTRQQYLTGQSESFSHDELGRLTTWQSADSGATWKVEYGYDSIGNMQRKEESLGGTSQGATTFTVGPTTDCAGPAGPHSMTTVDSGGAKECYGYNARGQQTAGADGRSVTYTEYGLPTKLTRGGVDWTFGYDATHQRAFKKGPTQSTFYVGALYEKRVNADGSESHVMYVPGADGVKAQITLDGVGVATIDYLMRDHLGSVSKAGEQDMRFDPYGSRIAGSAPPTPASQSASSRVRLGFTGQEEDDDLGLVNMNGRIYDPAIARFLTPDPVVSMLSPSQSWNRYSYANNSPLFFTDPTGFDEEGEDHGYVPPPQFMPGIGFVDPTTGMAIGSQCSNCTWTVGGDAPTGDFSGSYGIAASGAAIGSFDEAGAGTSSAQQGDGVLGDYGGKDTSGWMTASVSTNKLNALTDAEKKLAKENPMKFALAIAAGREAVRATKERFSDVEAADGGPGNAFQHAYWNALMEQWVGDNFASRYATAHEDFGPNHILDADNMMDLYNNQVGRMIGAASLQGPYIFTFGFGLADRVELALNMGYLVYIRDAPGWNPAQKVFIYGEHL